MMLSDADSGGLRVVEAKGLRLWRTVHTLNRKARIEQVNSNTFYFFMVNSRNFTVYLLYKGDEAIGYAAWNQHEDGTPTLRQLYIKPEERRKGYGSYLLLESKRLFSNDAPIFYVESPNYATCCMLVKLGFAEWDGNRVRGKNIYFVQGA
jgi:predicted GNAT family acetyltransferase